MIDASGGRIPLVRYRRRAPSARPCTTPKANGYGSRASWTTAASRWPTLTAENVIRAFMVGRQNWSLSQKQRGAGAHASATIYSVIETAKINGLEPYAYLLEVLKNLPGAASDEVIDPLLPWHQDESLYALKSAG